MNTPHNYHDAEIAGIAYSRTGSSALISLEQVNGTETRIMFSGVLAFRANDFGLQNVISRVLNSSSRKFATNEIHDYIQWAHSQHDYRASISGGKIAELEAALSQGEITLFVFEPSVGAEIVVLCESVHITDIQPQQ